MTQETPTAGAAPMIRFSNVNKNYGEVQGSR